MTKKDAVYKSIIETFKNDQVPFQEGVSNAETVLDRTLRAKAVSILSQKLIRREVEAFTPILDRSQLLSYVDKMITKYMRKDCRLMGVANAKQLNIINSDPQIMALRILLDGCNDDAKASEIRSFIASRSKEITEGK